MLSASSAQYYRVDTSPSNLTARDTPEGPGLAQRLEHLEEFLPQREAVQKEVRLQPSSIVFATEDACPLIERQRALGRSRIIGPPASDVLFRPEEIHVVSGIRPVVIPPRGRQASLANHGLREGPHRVVAHVQPERLCAVEAAGIDLHVLAGE